MTAGAGVEQLLQELPLTERELLELSPDPAAWTGLCERVFQALDEAEGVIWELVDHQVGAGTGLPPNILARELIDRLAWKLQSHADPREVELALQWVAASPDSLFNQRKRSHEAKR